MRMKIIVILLLLGFGTVRAEIEFRLLWQIPGNLTDVCISDLDEDGYKEILVATGYSYEKMLSTPSGSVTASICEGTLSQFENDGKLIWEKKVCKNDTAVDPCYSNGCISAIHADSICTTTRKLIFVGCCYCGKSSIVRVLTSNGEPVSELYDDDGLGNPVPISGCVRKILTEDINLDNCKDVILVTNLELFLYITNCIDCTIPVIPTFKTTLLPVANRPQGTINDVIVADFENVPGALPTKEIVVAADDVTVYDFVPGPNVLVQRWKYNLIPGEPARAIYAFDLDSDTATNVIDRDPDLEPELIVGESWYLYILDDLLTAPPSADLKWEYSTSPYNVGTVGAGRFVGPRNVMGGAASLVYILDYNGSLLQTFNAPDEVRKLDLADFDKDGRNELIVFSNNYVSVFSTAEMLWSSGNFQGTFIDGAVLDLNLDGYPEIVAGYTSGVYVIGVEELKSITGSEADQLYNKGKELVEKGDFVEAIIYFEQARAKYEEMGNTFMAVQCKKRISECEKYLDTDRVVAEAMENLRNYNYEDASYLFGEAADLFARVGDKSTMSHMRVLKEASEKLWQANTTLTEAHHLLLDGRYTEAEVEATWARNSFEDVSTLFLTMSLDSLYETLKLQISARMRECDEIKALCNDLTEVEELKKEAGQCTADGNRLFRNEQYSEAKSSFERGKELYTKAAQEFDEIQIALGRRANSFRRDISDIEGKIKTLEQSEIYKTYGDAQTSAAILNLKEKKSMYEELINEYEDLAETMGKKAKECRTSGSNASGQADESYSLSDKFLEYGKDVLQPPTSLVLGLALLVVALIGVAAGKGRYAALAFLVIMLIFLGIAAFRFLMME